MTWFKVDDSFWSHPKVMGLSDEAIAMWVRAGSYACQHLTDGAIMSRVTHALGTRGAAEELVAAGLWARADDGYIFHDWGEYQETSVDVKKRRDQWKERQKRARKKANVTQGVTRESLSPIPIPIPVNTTSKDVVSRAKALPPDWEPTEAHHRIANERGVNISVEVEKLRDWATSKGEKRKDWDATFRNWLRNASPAQPDYARSKVSQRLDGAYALIQSYEMQEGRSPWTDQRQLDS